MSQLIQRPNGIILVTGPTGSGKTTTLVRVPEQDQPPDVNILTVEDPVEYQIDGIPRSRSAQDRSHLRQRAARVLAPGSRRHHGRRNPRSRKRRRSPFTPLDMDEVLKLALEGPAHPAPAVGRCRRGGRRGSRRRHALRGVNLSTAAFVTSVAGPGGFPKEALPEVAMVGRSNVGKSSLINALAGQPLARTSAAPGKTRLANYYRLQRDGEVPFFLVDLPGYGYARGGDRAAAEFEVLADAFFGRIDRQGRSPVRGGLPARRQPPPRAAERSQAWALARRPGRGTRGPGHEARQTDAGRTPASSP